MFPDSHLNISLIGEPELPSDPNFIAIRTWPAVFSYKCLAVSAGRSAVTSSERSIIFLTVTHFSVASSDLSD